MKTKKIKIHFKRNWQLWLLALIVMGGFFVRTYRYSDWLIFQADQSRDAYYAKEAYDEGLGQLRILGPKVDMAYLEGDKNPRGETLHLGPLYYYLQFLFMWLLKNVKPWVVALPDLLLSVAAIPLLYYLSRYFFSKIISLLITALFSFSYFNVFYSRFAWNPNQLIFWEILFSIGLVKATQRNDNHKGWWMLAAIFSLLIISQIHFVAFSGFFILGLVFWIVRKPKNIAKKYWVAALGLLVLLNIPLAASEIKNNGDNTKRFVVAMTKSPKNEKSFLKKTHHVIKKEGEFFSVALTSFNDKELDHIEIVGQVILIASFALLVYLFLRRKSGFVFAKNQKKLVLMTLLWLSAYFFIFHKISHKLDNDRYFLTVSPLVFLLLGVWFSLLSKIRFKYLGTILMYLIFATCLAGQIGAISFWYETLAHGKEPVDTFRKPKLSPLDDLATYGEMSRASGYMAEEAKREKKTICFLSGNYQHNLGIEYIGETEFPSQKFRRFGKLDYDLGCKFFYLVRTKRGKKDIDEEFLPRFNLKDSKKFGYLTVWELELKEKARREIVEKELKNPPEKGGSDDDPRAEKWADLFNKQGIQPK